MKSKCKCGHELDRHWWGDFGEQESRCEVEGCTCPEYQPCEVADEPEPKFEPITKCGGVWPVNPGGKPEHRIKLPLAKRTAIYDCRNLQKLQYDTDEASANQQLQAIVKEIFEKLDGLRKLFGEKGVIIYGTEYEALKSEYLGG